MPPAAVLFDLYDTIVRSDWSLWRTQVGEVLGVDPWVVDRAYTDTRPARSVGAYLDVEAEIRAVIEAIGIADPPTDLVRSVASAEYAFMESGVVLEDDVVPVVAKLRDRGVRTALVSNCSHPTLPLVERLGLHGIFDEVILSFQVGARKPQAAIYRAALEAVGGVAPADALFVDDQVWFCDGARALGIDTRLILRPGADPSEGVSDQANGHMVITELSPVLDV